ncbi:conserved domain protein [Turicibacter sp. HGF1]|nr:GNAT family N-acetyltransferase [Turicibacter sp. HGF1]EGC92072.1 conserved domain protein [Turicibacter sp. HGF1]
MKQFENLSFEILHETDLTILTPIMERAFDEDTRIHLNKPKGGPAGYDNGDFLRRFGLHPNSTSYKISMDGKPIGSIILWLNHDTNIHFLGNIFIDPSLQNKGIGLKIWNFIEKQYPNTLK